MKQLFIIMGLSMLFYSCTKEDIQTLDEKSMLSAELESVVNEFEESIKDEQTPTTVEETVASEEVLKSIQDSLKNIGSGYLSSKVKTYALLDEGRTRKVGVFKFSTCGSYKEFVYFMDCEDGGWTNTEGSVGATAADHNKNLKFHFCVVPYGFYNGGTLLLTLSGWSKYDGDVDIVDRYHDNEDHDNKNNIDNYAGGTTENLDFPGYCTFGDNTMLTWRFSERKTVTLPFQYGVLTNSFTTQDGSINIDDENGRNQNFARLFRHVASTETVSDRYMPDERFRGITTGTNTGYHIKINNN